MNFRNMAREKGEENPDRFAIEMMRFNVRAEWFSQEYGTE